MAENHKHIILYGTTWCPDCKRSKQFLGEQRIHYDWVDIENDADAMNYVEQVNRGKRIIPTIVFPDGSILVEPSNAELAEKLGISMTAERTFYDVIIVVSADRATQLARFVERGGTADNFSARLNHQLPLEDKEQKADYIINNNGTREATREQVEHLWAALRQKHAGTDPGKEGA